MAPTIETVSEREAEGRTAVRCSRGARVPGRRLERSHRLFHAETAAGWPNVGSRRATTRAQRDGETMDLTIRPVSTGSEEHHDYHVFVGAFEGDRHAPWSTHRGSDTN